MAIIKQTSKTPLRGAAKPVSRALSTDTLPNFRNLGSLLRIILLVNALAVITVLIRLDDWHNFSKALILLAGKLEMPLLFAAFLVYLLGPWLERQSWRVLTYLFTTFSLCLGWFSANFLIPSDPPDSLRRMLWAAGAALLLCGYMHWRQVRRTPAVTEARMMALNARIRPHFIFNSLNGVLGVIRSDPKRAERALESLADLFRVLMQENRRLVSLCDEIELCNQYLDIERLRLGERLQVSWDIKHVPLDAKIPPLMLQPLLENAVYHGVEPSTQPATILIHLRQRGKDIVLQVSNPIAETARTAQGNRMALQNIRERLALFFDLEASLKIEEADGVFSVFIRFPMRREA